MTNVQKFERKSDLYYNGYRRFKISRHTSCGQQAVKLFIWVKAGLSTRCQLHVHDRCASEPTALEDIMAQLKYYFDLMSQPCRAVYIFLKVNKIPFEEKRIHIHKGEALYLLAWTPRMFPSPSLGY